MEPYSSQFTISLPSDASRDVYPDNKISNYKTQLSQSIPLDQGEWEVGLVDIHYPTNWINVNKDEMVGQLMTVPGSWVKFSVPEGHYSDAQTFLKVLDGILKSKSNNYIYLKKNVNAEIDKEYEDPVTVEIASDPNTNRRSVVKFSKPLAAVLGLFDKIMFVDQSLHLPLTGKKPSDRGLVKRRGRSGRLLRVHGIITRYLKESWTGHKARKTIYSLPRAVDLRRGFKMFYIYSDIIEYRHVGDTMANLLSVFTPESKKKNRDNEMVHKEFFYPDYISIRKGMSYLNTIQIMVTDEMGRAVSFTHGKVLVQLHFRKKLNFIE